MLSIVTCPKPYLGVSKEIQCAALNSWMKIIDPQNIFLLGDDPGVKEAAEQSGVRHVPFIKKTTSGIPLVNSLFETAVATVQTKYIIYVNADIILGADLLTAVETIARSEKRFLMVGQRIDFNWSSDDLTQNNFPDNIFEKARICGTYAGLNWIDYFIFPRYFWPTIPPFALGRCAWDNWLLYAAWESGGALINTTDGITAVHLNHDYVHAKEKTQKGVWQSLEAKENYRLAANHLFDLLDCRYVLRKGVLSRPRHRQHVERRVERLKQYHPSIFWALPSFTLRRMFSWLFPDL